MTAEFERFLILFDRLAHLSDSCARAVPDDKLDWIPIDNPDVRYGDRITDVTIKGLYLHMVVSEHHWIRQLRDCDDGHDIPVPKDPELTDRLAAGDFRIEVMRLHDANLAALRELPDSALDRSVSYTGRTFTGMGFLWAMYAHRSYHLGNIDIYMRQGRCSPPNFFDFEPPAMA